MLKQDIIWKQREDVYSCIFGQWTRANANEAEEEEEEEALNEQGLKSGGRYRSPPIPLLLSGRASPIKWNLSSLIKIYFTPRFISKFSSFSKSLENSSFLYITQDLTNLQASLTLLFLSSNSNLFSIQSLVSFLPRMIDQRILLPSEIDVRHPRTAHLMHSSLAFFSS